VTGLSEELDALCQTEGLLDTVVRSLEDVIFVLDLSCRYYGLWGRWIERHAVDPTTILGKTCDEVWAQDGYGEFDEVNQQVLVGETVVFDRWFEMPWGSVYYQSTLSPLLGADGRVIGICGVRRDITDLKRAEDSIRREKEYAEHLIDSANVMVVGLDSVGNVRLFNTAAEQLTGWRRADIIGANWFETVVPKDRYPAAWEAFRSLYACDVDDVRPRTLRRCSEGPILTHSGEERTISWMDSEVPEADRELDIVSFGVDVSEARIHEQMLEHLATHDPLTDLPNRRSFESALGRSVARARRGTVSTVLFIDVDDFKACNDEYGHAFGDAILSEIATELQLQVRVPDLVARIGGDEFAALLEGATVDAAGDVAARMRAGVAAMAKRHGIQLDLSIGLMGMDATSDFERVLSGADTAMYTSKRSGAGVVVFESA